MAAWADLGGREHIIRVKTLCFTSAEAGRSSQQGGRATGTDGTAATSTPALEGPPPHKVLPPLLATVFFCSEPEVLSQGVMLHKTNTTFSESAPRTPPPPDALRKHLLSRVGQLTTQMA